MPILIPTPAEVAAMPWHPRRKALARLRVVVNQYRDVDLPTERMWADDDEGWPEATRNEARRLLAAMPVDADAASHRVAVGGRSE